MQSGDVVRFEDGVSYLIVNSAFYHDVPGAGPERAYQALVLSPLVPTAGDAPGG